MTSAKEGTRTLTGVTPLEPEADALREISESGREDSLEVYAKSYTQKTARKRTTRTNTGARTETVSTEKESSVLKRVFDTLKCCGGVEAYRNNVGAIKKGQRYIRYGLDVGSSDIVGIVAPYGRWLCIECKRPKNGEVAMRQLKWLDKMRRYGAVVAIVSNPEDVFALVDQARRATV